MVRVKGAAGLLVPAVVLAGSTVALGGLATSVVGYTAGTTANPSYVDPQVALGAPSRYIDDPVYGGAVTMFNPPWLSSQIVSIGDGGSLTLEFDVPVVDDPGHQFGVDLIFFGNAGFVDIAYPTGQLGSSVVTFGGGSGTLEVSADGVNFFEIPGVLGKQFPTQGYTDVPAQSASAGLSPTDYHRPIDPALTLDDFAGLSYAGAMSLYGGSAGGAPIDLSLAVDQFGQPAGLTSASFVRISHAGLGSIEVDALVAVPEPSGLAMLLFAAAGSFILKPTRRERD